MTPLNKTAAEVVINHQQTAATGESSTANDQRRTTNDRFHVHAMTDVTGFGLIGHARGMALASNVALHLRSSSTPVLEGALDCVCAGHTSGGLQAHRGFAECCVGYEGRFPDNL